MERDDGSRGLARLMGWFYVLTGVWPLLHIRSFEWVTGPKTDRWLVKTVGALITTTGAMLLLAARRERAPTEVAALAIGNAAALATIDVVYVAKNRIRPVYLFDAVAEVALVAAWVRAMQRRSGAGGDDCMAGSPKQAEWRPFGAAPFRSRIRTSRLTPKRHHLLSQPIEQGAAFRRFVAPVESAIEPSSAMRHLQSLVGAATAGRARRAIDATWRGTK